MIRTSDLRGCPMAREKFVKACEASDRRNENQTRKRSPQDMKKIFKSFADYVIREA